MIDQDITMLQLGASMLSPNDFLVNVLNKFCLIQWSSKEFDCSGDDSIRQTTTLVEEFFSLLIYVLGERWTISSNILETLTPPPPTWRMSILFCSLQIIIFQIHSWCWPSHWWGCSSSWGYSFVVRRADDLFCPSKSTLWGWKQRERIRKSYRVLSYFQETQFIEVWLQLIPNPVHAYLYYNKTLFSSVSLGPSGKGVFELRPEFYNEYNAFFYHYTKEEQSKSDETQRVRKRARSGKVVTHSFIFKFFSKRSLLIFRFLWLQRRTGMPSSSSTPSFDTSVFRLGKHHAMRPVSLLDRISLRKSWQFKVQVLFWKPGIDNALLPFRSWWVLPENLTHCVFLRSTEFSFSSGYASVRKNDDQMSLRQNHSSSPSEPSIITYFLFWNN